jgi:hypothetical protein
MSFLFSFLRSCFLRGSARERFLSLSFSRFHKIMFLFWNLFCATCFHSALQEWLNDKFRSYFVGLNCFPCRYTLHCYFELY